MSAAIGADALRTGLLGGEEIALLDVREEAAFGPEHILLAIHLPLSRLELRAAWLVPRRDTRIVLCDGGGEGLAERAAGILEGYGYRNVAVLDGGVAAWRAAGHAVFSGVNVPSKAFGEVVEHGYRTPSIAAQELKARIDARENMVIVDSRPLDEFRVMSIPTATCVPGGELVWRIGALAPDPETLVVVNCAGRTRSIMGAQSLINAGIPEPRGRPAQRHHGLAPGRPRARSRPDPLPARGVARPGGGCAPPRAGGVRPLRGAADRPRDARSLAGGTGPHDLPFRRALARGVSGGPSARVDLGAGRPAGPGHRPLRRHAAGTPGAGRRRRRARRHDRILAEADGAARGRGARGWPVGRAPGGRAWPRARARPGDAALPRDRAGRAAGRARGGPHAARRSHPQRRLPHRPHRRRPPWRAHPPRRR